MSKGWTGGSTRAQRAVRAGVLARDGGMCMLRYPGEWRTRTGRTLHCMGRADCVHHTRGKGVTGDDPRYQVAACTPCNLRAGQPATTQDPVPVPRTQW